MTARRQDPIVIVEADPTWPASFEEQRSRLEPAFGDDLLLRPIEHIGSTAVPGLAAKPIIDLLAVVRDVATADERRPAIEATGWRHAAEEGDEPERRRSYCFPTPERRTHHLHVVEEDHPGWRGWLAFRDHLRAHPADAAAYEQLKRRLAAAEHGADPDDRSAYRAGKAPWILEVTARALGG